MHTYIPWILKIVIKPIHYTQFHYIQPHTQLIYLFCLYLVA